MQYIIKYSYFDRKNNPHTASTQINADSTIKAIGEINKQLESYGYSWDKLQEATVIGETMQSRSAPATNRSFCRGELFGLLGPNGAGKTCRRCLQQYAASFEKCPQCGNMLEPAHPVDRRSKSPRMDDSLD